MAHCSQIAAASLVLHLVRHQRAPCRHRVLCWLSSLPHALPPLTSSCLDFVLAVCHLCASRGDGLGERGAVYYARFFSGLFQERSTSVHAVADLLGEAKVVGGWDGGGGAVTAGERLSGREAKLLEDGDGEEGEGDDFMLGGLHSGSHHLTLVPRLAVLHRQSSLALLLRHAVLAVETRGFEGLSSLLQGLRDEAPALHELANTLSDAHQGGVGGLQAALHSATERAVLGVGVGGNGGGKYPPSSSPSHPPPPATLRAIMVAQGASGGSGGGGGGGGGSSFAAPALSTPPPSSALAYPTAIASLMRYFDYAYGTSVGGGSGVSGEFDTPLGILLRGVGGPGSTPSPRARELFISSTSAPPVGGSAFSGGSGGGGGGGGRVTAHHGILALARVLGVAGRREEVWNALQECLRLAQSSGDAPAASYVLEALHTLVAGEEEEEGKELGVEGEGEVEGEGGGVLGAASVAVAGGERGAASRWSGGGGGGGASRASTNPQGLSILRRIRVRAGELGLWRQHVRVSLKLVSHAMRGVCGSRSSRSRSSSRAYPMCLPVPHWVSLDGFTSCRLGGLALGVSALSGVGEGGGGEGSGGPSSSLSSAVGGGGGGGGMGGGGGAPSGAGGSHSSTSSGGGGACGVPGLSLPSFAYTPYLTLPPSTSRSLPDSLASVVSTALTSTTGAAAAGGGRLSRAVGGGGGGGGGAIPGAPPNPTAAATATAAAAALAAAGGGVWSSHLPLHWHETLEAQGEGHRVRAEVWGAIGGAAGAATGRGGLGARLLQAASLKCANVAKAFGVRRGEDWERWCGEVHVGGTLEFLLS